MARTAHHIRREAACLAPPVSRPWSPWRAVVVRELRYSAEGLRAAAREGRRPRPREVVRSVTVHSTARATGRGSDVAELARPQERRDRQAVRHQIGLLRTGLIADIETAPGYHRHSALWHS